MKGVVYAMWLRQLKRYWRSKERMIGTLAQPVLFLVALGFGFGPIFQKAGGGDYMQFLAPGIIAMSILFTSMFTGIEVIWDRQFGFLKETLVAPVPRTHIMIGRTLGGATVGVLQGTAIGIICLFFGFKITNMHYIPLALVFMFLTAVMFTALGTAIASRLQDMHAFPIIMNFLIMPLFFLSGALFPLEGLPKAVEFVARIDPFSYCVDGIRGTLNGSVHIGLATDFAVVAAATVIVLAVGSYLFSTIEI
ncbi:ABC transporter permease [Candidatus Woesearchaeota archaeon]|nr:ABC transporter permease [Candidatus Woesearchaeota archaeon]